MMEMYQTSAFSFCRFLLDINVLEKFFRYDVAVTNVLISYIQLKLLDNFLHERPENTSDVNENHRVFERNERKHRHCLREWCWLQRVEENLIGAIVDHHKSSVTSPVTKKAPKGNFFLPFWEFFESFNGILESVERDDVKRPVNLVHFSQFTQIAG
jgi:hypothetical protein